MCLLNRSSARLTLMCATFSFLALLIGCASSVAPPVSLPAPTWAQCSLEPPPMLMTVRDIEQRLLRSEAALGLCDAQGRAVIASWPK